ncbi:Nucleoid-associated protein [Frankliniella fusca]|uniref:Nucleoid-associated protein n=1 Tax=Frankliniella fusca TaxID=407009 RepID=A0AAE1GR65_9NEOP|nr:Nucleoid-associated protein [Frankliniella fusca]
MIPDPQPTITDEKLEEFKKDLQLSTPNCLFLYHLGSGFISNTLMGTEQILDVETDEGILKLAEECSKLLWKMAKKCDGQTGPFEVPNTRGQHNLRYGTKKEPSALTHQQQKHF